MKKLLIIALALSLASCTSKIDKKVVATDYQTTIEEIKSDNPEYTDEDYKMASKELDKYSAKLMANPSEPLDITYRELLNKAQAKNKEIKEAQDKYDASVKKLQDAFSITLTSGKYVDISGMYPTYSHGYITEMKSENKTDKEVTAIKGKVVLTNDKGERLLHILIDEAVEFAPNEKAEGKMSNIIFEDDNYVELKALPFTALKQEWQPQKIIFKDGSTLEALPKPYY